MKALPPGKEYNDKYYVGFFRCGTLLAIMDLILDYRINHIAYIGLFMMKLEYQGKGIDSKIIAECSKHLQALGFDKMCLGVNNGNVQSNTFWKKNGFIEVDECECFVMELVL
jgi:ribosomal protein S18 acetylase RimI-like enzyme